MDKTMAAAFWVVAANMNIVYLRIQSSVWILYHFVFTFYSLL